MFQIHCKTLQCIALQLISTCCKSTDSGNILRVVTIVAVVTIFVYDIIEGKLSLQEHKKYQMTVYIDSVSTKSSDCMNISNSSNSVTL